MAGVRRYLMGDYYPLTPYSIDSDIWMAWQFNRPRQGDGVIQVFRRDYSTRTAQRLHLRGLQPDMLYELKDADTSGSHALDRPRPDERRAGRSAAIRARGGDHYLSAHSPFLIQAT